MNENGGITLRGKPLYLQIMYNIIRLYNKVSVIAVSLSAEFALHDLPINRDKRDLFVLLLLTRICRYMVLYYYTVFHRV